jgi:hypothetical protein
MEIAAGHPAAQVGTIEVMGGALGLAILASLAASRTETQLASGEGHLAALTSGYHVAFFVGAVFAAAAALVSVALLGASTDSDDVAHGAPAEQPEGLAEVA